MEGEGTEVEREGGKGDGGEVKKGRGGERGGDKEREMEE